MGRSLRFPEEFVFGVATSAYQVEGDNRNADWWEWEESGRVPSRSGKACNHWELYRIDIEIMAELGIQAYRFSVEWSRLFPQPKRIDYGALQRYHEILALLRRYGIEPVITIHHFTNPIWFARLGGWRKSENIEHFARYVELLADEFRDVRLWITINEPNVYAFMGFIQGSWPPGERNPKLADAVLRNLAEAHARAYEILRGRGAVGIAQNMMWFVPRSSSRLDSRAKERVEEIWNWGFLKGVISGELRGFAGRYRVRESGLDFIGVNYYTALKVGHSWNPLRMFLSIEPLQSPARSTMGYYIHPRGIKEVVAETHRIFGKEIYITENGFAVESDDLRSRAIVEHLYCLLKAMELGARVKGYFYWSLLDNFEWDRGYTQRFGLVEVDFQTFERRLRRSAEVYSTIIRSRDLGEVMKRVGAESAC
ncbi:MAG: glycoside hydrolase family 1 protein [Crenarchaeota archaeon]|nr:glycoside hydrolase family 1 protein [Thermoproteota archaeon]